LLPFDPAPAAAAGGPRRIFLGWQAPILVSAARWLLTQLGPELGDVLVAVPGARAARRLRELLARAAPKDWHPPRVLTQGELVDLLVPLERPAAARLTRTLVWERALEALDAADLARLQRRSSDALGERLRLAETVRALHGELAPEGRDFAALARAGFAPGLEAESERWTVLARAQAHYRDELARLGEVDPHESRSQAIADGRIARDRRVVLVGVADMNQLLARALEQLGPAATALIGAPEELAPGFDALGRLVPAFWCERELPLADAAWRVAEKPVDQGEAVRAVLDEWHGEFTPAELVLGVADESVVPFLERQLADCGVAARRAAGTPLERARPVRLLRALARYLARRGYAELAALARDPDLARAVAGDPDAPARLDRYYLERYPRRAGDVLGTKDFEEATRAFHAALEASLGPLAGDTRRAAGEWAAPVRAFLARVYPGALAEASEEERELAAALELVGAALGELEEVPRGVALAALDAAGALELLLRALRGQRVPPAPASALGAAVELVGWLDLPLDDAPALILTGFNEGRVPEGLGAHPFLPGSRRAELGLPDERARLARDVYAATLVLATRRRCVFVSGRRSQDGDPLVPSRLAFHCPRAAVAARVAIFLPKDDGRRPEAPDEDEAPRSHAAPILPGWKAPARLRVSAFKSYLDSPYRFYLEHVLGLTTLDDRSSELDPRRFGTLTHAVLEDLGRDGPHGSSDPAEVGDFLAAALRRHAAAGFGPDPLPAVALQVEQLEHRLRLFAREQARRAAEGWRIHAVEWRASAPVWLEVDGEKLELTGRIDRIDRHPDGSWAILDYKTGDKQKGPREAHFKKDGSFLDLQLPLYRHLARELGFSGEPELGYAWIGKEDTGTGFFLAHFAPAELEAALAEARRIVRAVRHGDFTELGREPFEEIYQAIFGLGMLGGAETGA
jgi:RecB family exonuclease